MKNKIYIVGGIIGIAIIGLLVLQGRSTEPSLVVTEIPLGDPLDAAADFYGEWLDAARSTSTDPYQAGLATAPVLSEVVRVKLATAQLDESTIDPVFCQEELPRRVRLKPVFAQDTEAQYMVLPDEVVPDRAMVTVRAVDGDWQITDISCISAEQGEEREFTFERTGNLLKSVPPPLDPEYWHIVFEENGQQGHAAPLFFDPTSVCVSESGTESVCDPSTFVEAAKVTVQGQMTESGVEVKRVQF